MGKQKISDALMGCLEIPIFIISGADRFANTPLAAKLSFLIPVLLIPFSAWLAMANPGFVDETVVSVAIKLLIEFLICSLIYLTAVYFVARHLDRSQYFLKFVNANNWLNLTQIVFIAPFFLAVMVGHWQWGEIHGFLIFLIIYGYVYQAFMITYALRINWMLAAALSILGMAINQNVHPLIFNWP